MKFSKTRAWESGAIDDLDHFNAQNKSVKDPCARCGVYSFEVSLPLDSSDVPVGDKMYCIDCLGRVEDYINECEEA